MNRKLGPFEEAPVTAEQIITDAASLSVSERLRVCPSNLGFAARCRSRTKFRKSSRSFDRRMQNYRQNPESAMTLDELRRRLDG